MARSRSTPHNSRKKIGITRAHLEEDAGKLLHQEFEGQSGIDLNRAGTPLLEVVSEPDLRSPAEAIVYLKKLHTLVRYLEICDGNMQEGSFRCDANISVRPAGEISLGTRCELKNLNSFRFIEKGLQFEIERQIQLIEDGGQVSQETRLYDPDANLTRPMRSKEEAHDYRYFPDPDLPPLVVDDELLAVARSSLPELPDARCYRFSSTYQMSQNDAELLTSDRELADYFEQTAAACGDSRSAANWITGEWMGYLNRDGLRFGESRVTPQMLGDLIAKINDNSISGKIAKKVFDGMWNNEGNASEIIAARNLEQITDSDEIERAIDHVIDNCTEQVMRYRSGQEKGFWLSGRTSYAGNGGQSQPEDGQQNPAGQTVW